MMSTALGASVNAQQLEAFLHLIIADNRRMQQSGLPGTPLCIWGSHGIGKTEIVRSFARANQYQLAYLAPAQIEEMGDLTGMPVTTAEGKTVFYPPSWVPDTPGPGILLIDDVNRADQRILKGIMQLLQDGALISWALPADWHIILTANPDDGQYDVTRMDDALLSRMMHITLSFNVAHWISWAETQKLDPRCIHFVLNHPACFGGKRTNARSLTRLFHAIAPIAAVDEQLDIIYQLAAASVDEETVQLLMNYFRHQASGIPSVSAILTSDDFSAEIYPRIAQAVIGPPLRSDILAALCAQIAHYANDKRIQPGKQENTNLKAFLLMDLLPRDLRFSLARTLAGTALADVLYEDPDLALLMI
jgi:hypothetical protein